MKTEQRLTVAKAGGGGGGERAQRSRHKPSERRGRYAQHGDCREEHCAGDVNLSKLQGTVEDRGAWRAIIHEVAKSQGGLRD